MPTPHSLAQANMVDVPSIKPNRFISQTLDQWAKRPANTVRPIMIWGAPGIGKTDCVEELTQKLSERLNKPFYFHPVILSYYNATDLKGIPTFDIEREFTKWLRPDIFNMSSDPNVGHVLFFDEITNATTSVAQCCYQITQKRMIATHKLPDNCYIICAGNRVIDKSGAMKMLKPLANRMRHFEFVANLKDWKDWAWKQTNFDPRIISFLNFRPDLLFQYDPSSDNVAFPTPRSWAAVSETTYSTDVSEVLELISGDIGNSAAREFMTYCRIYQSIPDVDAIMAGRDVKIPVEPDIIYALCGAIAAKIGETDVRDAEGKPISKNEERIRNLLIYLLQLDREYQFVSFYDVCKLPGASMKVAKCPEFLNWARANREYLA